MSDLANLLQAAGAHHAAGRREQAERAYRQVLQVQPGHVEACTSLGVTLAEQGKLDEATFHLRTALRFQPAHAPAHHNLGVALAQQGKLDAAAACLRQAIQLKPDYADAYYNLGNVLCEGDKTIFSVFSDSIEIEDEGCETT